MNMVTVGSAIGATIPTTFRQTRCNVLIDTGAMKGCMSQAYYQQLMLPTTRTLHSCNIKSANGTDLCPIGIIESEFKIGMKEYKNDFIVCKNLVRPCILGADFLRKHSIWTGWSPTGKVQLISQQKFLVESLEVVMKGPMIHNKQGIEILGRNLAVVSVFLDTKTLQENQVYEVKPNLLLTNEHPNLIVLPMLHLVQKEKHENTSMALINLDEDEKIFLKRGEILGCLETSSIEMNEIIQEKYDNIGEEGEKEDESLPLEKKFITSPAEVNTHRKMQLQDVEVTEENREKFRLLCEEFEDIFSKSSSDIGKTPLITMDIDTGDSPPVCQRPYSLPLKHREWVQKELETLEQAGVIVRSISPWASPIVVVPKKTEPGEPPRRRLCVDYRVINSLLPGVQKAHSKAKGILTLVPLPQIDHIYARLRGSQIFSTFDLRSGYHHMELSPEARAKSAFVTPLDKFEFTRCPFGLSQAPAYFQRLMNQVIKRLPFAFVYLDDVLIHSPDVETHLEHIRVLFQRLRKADLKLKDSKCNYFKTHVQYLGYTMKAQDVEAVMGKPGEGAEGGKHVKREGSHLVIKSEPGAEAEKVVILAIVPAEESTLIPYCIKEREEEDCETIATDSDIEEIDREEVKDVLKELAGLKRREAECYERLAKAVPDMQESEVVVVAEKVRGAELPECVHQMNQRIGNPRDFRATLAAGERLYGLYKYHQAGTQPISIPELCTHFDVGKTKIYELLRGEKYKYPPKEEMEKKPARRIQPEKVEPEEPPAKKVKKTKAVPTT